MDLQACRGTLVDRRDRLTREMDLDARLAAVREELVEGLERVDRLPVATEGYDAVAPGLRKSYRRARERMADAYEKPTAEAFHEWRKRVKYHRYHSRLLRSVWPGPMKPRRSELKSLSDVVGGENDLAGVPGDHGRGGAVHCRRAGAPGGGGRPPAVTAPAAGPADG